MPYLQILRYNGYNFFLIVVAVITLPVLLIIVHNSIIINS